MIAGLSPAGDFLRGHHVRVDFTPEPGGDARKQPAHLPETDVTDNHQIHVALRFFGSAGKRAKHKGERDSSVFQGCAQCVYKPAGLEHQVVNVRIEGVLVVSTIVKTIPILPRPDHADASESLEFLAHSCIVERRLSCNLAHVKLATFSCKEQAKGFGLDSRGEQFNQRIHNACLYHATAWLYHSINWDTEWYLVS